MGDTITPNNADPNAGGGSGAENKTVTPSNDPNAGAGNGGGQPAADPNAGKTVQPTTYKLPDGREVDGATLAEVYKSLLGDYTQKAQALSAYEKAGVKVEPQPNINKATQQPWEDPNWIPKNYAEIVAVSKAAVQAEREAQTRAEAEAKAQVAQQVEGELAEIKKIEPNVSEDLLFAHATKYGFTNLVQAFNNMRDLNVAIKQTQANTQKNLQNRANEVINAKGGEGGGNKTEGVDYGRVTQKGMNAIDFLRSLQGK